VILSPVSPIVSFLLFDEVIEIILATNIPPIGPVYKYACRVIKYNNAIEASINVI